MLFISRFGSFLFYLMCRLVLASEEFGQRCHPYPQSQHNDTWVASPECLRPVEYKLASSAVQAYRDVTRYISADAANWDVINWHLSSKEGSEMSCVDVGGNLGFYALHLAALGCNVQSFEIQPNVIKLASQSFRVNSADLARRLRLYHVGLADKPTVMYIRNAHGNGHLSRAGGSVEVPVVRGDDCIDQKKTALVKIDVEGFEVRALEGMSRTLAAGLVDALLVEIGPSRWSRADLNVTLGTRLLQSILGPRYHPFLIARRADSCPDSVFVSGSPGTDTRLSFGASLIALSWPQFAGLMQHMAASSADCNFFFSSLKAIPRLGVFNQAFKAAETKFEGKVISRGALSLECWLVRNQTRRLIPNWDTYLSLKETVGDIVKLPLADKIPLGEPWPDVKAKAKG
jgi:FkbM family methyltransferase